jgi:uncharacterized membrane protein YbhN (UPF0104 family)
VTDADDLSGVNGDLPGRSPEARRKAVIGGICLVVYLYVVFGVLLPSVVDYEEMLAAFAAVPPAWLLVVLLIGIAGWFAEGLALGVLIPGLRLLRATAVYLVMAAIGSTIPGPVKMAVGYGVFREWQVTAQAAVLGLTLNGLASQASKLLLPALAVLVLTIGGTIPGGGWVLAFLLLAPVALGIIVLAWVIRSEAFARRVGAFATRASGAVLRRVHREAPPDLTDRLLDFRDSARELLIREAVPTTLSQVLARTIGYVLLLASMRAVGVSAEVLPADQILAVYAAVMVITLLPIAPGGAGLPEILYISFFTRIVADPSLDDTLAAGVMLMRGVSWFLPIPVGYATLLVIQRRARRRRAEQPAPAGEAPSGEPAS